jgi:hypothetical protein
VIICYPSCISMEESSKHLQWVLRHTPFFISLRFCPSPCHPLDILHVFIQKPDFQTWKPPKNMVLPHNDGCEPFWLLRCLPFTPKNLTCRPPSYFGCWRFDICCSIVTSVAVVTHLFFSLHNYAHLLFKRDYFTITSATLGT